MANKIKNIKPLVIGLGVAGKRHLEAQLNLGVKTGVYTTNPQTYDLLKNQTNVTVFDNLAEGMDWSNLVHVCTPDDKHTEFVEMAIKKGKAVLCEKAFTTNLSDALYLQQLTHKYNGTLIVGQNYRLTPTFAETKKRILKGVLGNITGIETTYLHDMTQYQARAPLRKNEDFMYVGGSHAIDLACWIVDEPVVSIVASATESKGDNFPKSYTIQLTFKSGLLGQVILDANLPQAKNGTDLKVMGTQGELASHNKIDELIFTKISDKQTELIKLPNNNTLTTALEVKIVDNFLSGEIITYEPLPGVDEAVNIIKILEGIQKAVVSGKAEII